MRHLVPLLVLLASCTPKDDVNAEDPLLDLKASKEWSIPGLSAKAHVVYGELGVPSVYAENQA